MQVPDEAVQAAMARRADLLADRPDPTVLSDETLTRRMLEAAAPILAEAWGAGERAPLSRAQVRKVACPTCGARQGEYCLSKSTGYPPLPPYPTSPVHTARRRLAEQLRYSAPEVPGE